MKILVTGMSGFVGRHLINFLNTELEATCVGVTRTPLDTPNTICCELTDYDQVEKTIKETRPSHIFHVAGSFSNNFETDFRNNVLTSKNILDATVKHKYNTRIMLMGSAAEYGEISDSDNPVTEQQPLNPLSVYGWSKAAQSLLAPLYANQYGLEVMIARTFNLFGNGLSEKLFVGRVEKQILGMQAGTNKQIKVGSLDSQRDYIDIEQACKMYLTIATKGVAGEAYNVGSGTATSMRQVLHNMLRRHNLDISVVDESPQNGTTNEVSTIYADVRKITALTLPTL